MKNVPMILEGKYILEKIYPNYVLYSHIEYGYKECFSFNDLELIEETKKYREASKGGAIKI